jgi:hypothetical protein
MTELALHILDIAKNSTRALAKLVNISVCADTKENTLTISVADNGKGMSKELLNSVIDPFATTRKTRKVGLGIPLFRQAALHTEGSFNIESEEGVGTKTTAVFTLDHIDRVPMGDLPGTITVLIGGDPEVDFTLYYKVDDREYEFDTRPVREIMEGIPLSEPEILAYIEGMLAENLENINGGIII